MNKKVTIGLVQMACSANPLENESKAYQLVESAAQAGAQIICLPELYRSQYFCIEENYDNFTLAEPIQGKSFALFKELAARYKVYLIVPIFEQRASGLFHNSLFILNPAGEIALIYRKLHIPHDPGFSEKFYFTPGDTGVKVMRSSLIDFSALICWDQWYPETARLACLQGAELLFYPTAIGWSDDEPEAMGRKQLDAWRTIQRAHAIANGMYVVAVNRIGREGSLTFWGNSFVADPFGEVVFELDHQAEGAFTFELDLSSVYYHRERWPFLRDRRVDCYTPLNQRFIDGTN